MIFILFTAHNKNFTNYIYKMLDHRFSSKIAEQHQKIFSNL